MRLQDKVVVITGSTRGIGKSIALACAGKGASVVVCSRSAEAVQRTVDEMKARGYVTAGITCDTTVPGSLAYKDIATSPRCSGELDNLPSVLDDFGVPLDTVGQGFVDIAPQEPGKVTGQLYSLLHGKRLFRGILKMTHARMTDKLK